MIHLSAKTEFWEFHFFMWIISLFLCMGNIDDCRKFFDFIYFHNILLNFESINVFNVNF